MNRASITQGRFRQSLPAISLSIERMTDSVPQDGYFYVLLEGETKGRFRNKGQAIALYKSILQASGYTPPPIQPTAKPTNDKVERYLDDLESYWSQSHKHMKRGGKGRY